MMWGSCFLVTLHPERCRPAFIVSQSVDILNTSILHLQPGCRCLGLSCLVLFFLLSCLVLSYLVLSCLDLACLILSCIVLSGLVLSGLVLSCLVLTYPVCAMSPSRDKPLYNTAAVLCLAAAALVSGPLSPPSLSLIVISVPKGESGPAYKFTVIWWGPGGAPCKYAVIWRGPGWAPVNMQ